MQFAERVSRLGTESAFEVLARAKTLEAQGHSIIHLEIGEPDFATPSHIIEAAVRALHDGYTHYGPTPGLPLLREAIARYIARTRGIAVSPEGIVVTPGAKPIIFYSIMICAGPGDEVLVPDPGFPIYASAVRFAGATPVPYQLLESKGFRLDLDELAAKLTPRTRMLILNSPSNPTGGVLTRADLERIAELVQGRPITILSDEVYSRIIYGAEHVSIASLPGMARQTILLDGFSKTYAMTGWRLGYGVTTPEIAQKLALMQVNCTSCAASFVQMAAIAALEGPQDAVERMVAEFARRREVIVAGLNRLPGVRCVAPEGTFYAFPNVNSYCTNGRTSRDLADYLLDRAGVAVLWGTSFGEAGEGYLRLSFANSLENIQEALRRIEQALAELAASPPPAFPDSAGAAGRRSS